MSGFNVYPREVEEVLRKHPNVGDCAVVGDHDEQTGERVRAVVVRDPPDADLTADEVIEFCSHSLAPYKLPSQVDDRLRDPAQRHRQGFAPGAAAHTHVIVFPIMATFVAVVFAVATWRALARTRGWLCASGRSRSRISPSGAEPSCGERSSTGTPATYRVFYGFGAVLNVAWLGLGTLWLVWERSAAAVMTIVLIAVSAWALWVVGIRGLHPRSDRRPGRRAAPRGPRTSCPCLLGTCRVGSRSPAPLSFSPVLACRSPKRGTASAWGF